MLHEPGRPVTVEELELDEPKADEVLVAVAAAGVCHSDLHLAEGALGKGRWPMVLGHEGAGVVERVGERVTHVAPGDRVAFSFVPSCGACRQCRAGRRNLCEPAGRAAFRGTLMDGTSRLRALDGTAIQHGLTTACFAERTVIAGASAVPLGAEVPLWQASLLGCGVVTGVGAVRNAARVQIGDRLCVIGCGGVGLQVVAAARLAGAATIVAVDRDPGRLALAIARGATHAVDTST
ncbi:MAG: alcohol dehydrogenase catalytic domain-containing protein, partial [Solirubrobacteraceae bacterium]